MNANDVRTIERAVPGKKLVTVSPETTVGRALHSMRLHGIHHLIVMKDGKCLGVVSARELSAAASIYDEWYGAEINVTVGDMMKKGVSPIAERTDVGLALSLMLRHGVTALAVEANGRVTGIVTETDLQRLLQKGAAKAS